MKEYACRGCVTWGVPLESRMTLGTRREPVLMFHFRLALENSQLGLQPEYINAGYLPSP